MTITMEISGYHRISVEQFAVGTTVTNNGTGPLVFMVAAQKHFSPHLLHVTIVLPGDIVLQQLPKKRPNDHQKVVFLVVL